MPDPNASPTPTQELTCPACGRDFVDEYPAGECDGCGLTVCGDCLHREVPDHHDKTCQDCLERMTPYGGVGADSNQELIAALADPKAPERDRVARLLGDRGAIEALEPLIRALGDDDQYLRSEAASALGKLGDSRAVGPLIGALKDPHPPVQVHAADSLALLGRDEAVESLLETLADPNPQAAGAAAQALGRLGHRAAHGPLEQLARGDGDQWPRRRALDALAILSGPASVEILREALSDPEPLVRGTACRILGKMDDSGQVRDLMDILERDQDPQVRRAAALALGRLEAHQAAGSLARALEDRDFRVRREAALVLHGLGWQPKTAREEVLLAFNLGRTPDRRGRDEEALSIIRALLDDPAPEIRRQAVQTLGRLEDADSLGVLERALADDNRVVAREALDALALIEPSRTEEYRARHLDLQVAREKARKARTEAPPGDAAGAAGAASGPGFEAVWLGLWLLGMALMGLAVGLFIKPFPSTPGWTTVLAAGAVCGLWLAASRMILSRFFPGLRRKRRK